MANGEHSENGNAGRLNLYLYRALVVGLSAWVLVTVRSNNDRSIAMELEIKHFNTSVSRLEGNINTLVTKPELELAVMKLEKEQLRFHNEFLQITRPEALVPLRNKHTGK